MPRGGYLAYITPVDRQGRPVDPDWGVGGGEHPDHELPGLGEHPDHGLPPGWGGFPGHPDQGLPGQRPPHVGNRPPGSGRPPRPGQGLPRPGRPVDPGYGVDESGSTGAGQLPVWPIGPDQGLPPVPGQGLPPTDPPPGTIWPPLPPDVEVTGKALVLAAIQGVGYRYIVVEIAPPKPDQGLPPEGGEQPAHPDQGLPPTAQPKGLRR